MSLGEQSFFWQYPEVPLTEEENEYYQVNGQEMSSIFESMYTTGISPEFVVQSADDSPRNYIGSSLAVSAGEGLNVIVSPGSAMIKGHPYLASLPINIGVAEGTTDILLRMDTTTEKPFIGLVSRPRSGGNIEDNVKREALIYELAIATIDVSVGAIAVTPTMINDHRLNMTLSPINNQPISGLMQPKPNVATLGIWEDWNKLDDYIKKSWTDFINQSTEAWATYINGKNAEWEQIKTNVNGEFDNLTNKFNTQITTNQSNFERWFVTLQATLDGNVAAELAGKVAKLQADKANKADVYTKTEIDTKFTEASESIANLQDTTYTKTQTDTLISSKTGINSTATHTNNVVAITAPPDTAQIIFIAPSNFVESDTYTLNGTAITITDLNNESLSDAWKSGVPVPLTIKDGKAFFKGGGGTYGTLSPQIRNFTAKAGNHQIALHWTNPSDSNHAGTYLVRKQGSRPQKLSDGTKIDVGKATSYTDNKPQNDKRYYYRAFTYNAKKQVQTELTGAVVSAMPKAFQLPRYTGQHAIFGNEEKGRIEMYTSGTLTLSDFNYDLFAVGGGGGSTKPKIDSSGSGGGYTQTLTQELHNTYSVNIGSGGRESVGGITEIIGNDLDMTVNGGLSGNTRNEGRGGSGGGCLGGNGHAGEGGSDGSDGGESSYGDAGATGQHSTTRAFKESNGVLYSGGGGGAANDPYRGKCGGDGGGGSGGYFKKSSSGTTGTSNSGGGGGGCYGRTGYPGSGGSGIAIIRWGY